MKLKSIIFFLGIVNILHFLVTGLLMKINFFLIKPEQTLVRMMLRANHIYILFSGLVIMLVSYTIKKDFEIKYPNVLFISILIISAVGINISFYVDPINHSGLSALVFQRKLTGFSIMGLLIATGLHILPIHFSDKKRNRNLHR
jgi:hypothetical protein